MVCKVNATQGAASKIWAIADDVRGAHRWFGILSQYILGILLHHFYSKRWQTILTVLSMQAW